MKKALKIIAIVLVAAFAVIQFIRPDFTNPPVVQADTLEANLQVPENVKTILDRSCKDCHTNETRYPWYSYIQPSAWFLANHIAEGRGQLNYSTWKTYPAAKQRRKLSQVCEQVQSGEMPLPSYLWVHRDAQMSDADIRILCDWTEAASAKITETK